MNLPLPGTRVLVVYISRRNPSLETATISGWVASRKGSLVLRDVPPGEGGYNGVARIARCDIVAVHEDKSL